MSDPAVMVQPMLTIDVDKPPDCRYCRQATVASAVEGRMRGDVAVREHKIPRSRGGRDVDENIVIACARCNSKKGARIFPDEWVHDNDRNTFLVMRHPVTVEPAAGLRAIGLASFITQSAPSPHMFSTIELAAILLEPPLEVRKTLARLHTFKALRLDVAEEPGIRVYST